MVVRPQLLDRGFRGLLACPSLSSLLWFCQFLWVLFSHMVHNLHDGVTPAGSRLVCPRSERRFHMLFFPFWAVSSCCHCPSECGHHMGQVLVGSHLCTPDGCRGASPFLLGWASALCLRLRLAPCHYCRWSSLRTRVFGCP